jgi:endonuclease YncB( thermonuclease family)
MPRSGRKHSASVKQPPERNAWGLVAFLLLGLGLGLAYFAFSSILTRKGDVAQSDAPDKESVRDANSGERERIRGKVRVIDGDSLEIGGLRIRLEGVDAPELDQECLRVGVAWPCGERSRSELSGLLGSDVVECMPIGRDRYQRILAKCYVDGTLVQAWMVRNGWALAYSEYSSEYEEFELEARRSSRGIWEGTFEKPSQFRRR